MFNSNAFTALRRALSLRTLLLMLLSAVPLALAPVTAHAATRGATIANVNLRAGPGTWYPVVITMPPSAALTIYGCIDSGPWCDVSWAGARGWVSSNYIGIRYQGQDVTLSPAIIPMIGLTVVAFNQAYWNNHYASQPWHGNWNTYYRRGAAYGGPGYGGAGRGGCVGAACGGSAVVRGPYGGGAAARGICGPDRCAGGAIGRYPGGGLEVRRGIIDR